MPNIFLVEDDSALSELIASYLQRNDFHVQVIARGDHVLDEYRRQKPDLVILDSIQTLWTDLAESAPGTVTQVRAAAQTVIRYAKSTGAAVVLVGHVTKEGQIAGPRVVEHMVDAVLYFEGEGGHHFRILRAVKNRFGPTDEIGVFDMSD